LPSLSTANPSIPSFILTHTPLPVLRVRLFPSVVCWGVPSLHRVSLRSKGPCTVDRVKHGSVRPPPSAPALPADQPSVGSFRNIRTHASLISCRHPAPLASRFHHRGRMPVDAARTHVPPACAPVKPLRPGTLRSARIPPPLSFPFPPAFSPSHWFVILFPRYMRPTSFSPSLPLDEYIRSRPIISLCHLICTQLPIRAFPLH